ncbi:MAG TPA: ATP-binding cassette domain-containing protein [Frankiaceae bacterium]|jgi:ABC-2 type transport system ATP-binding protein|nr:ATP-binding cassette domain-containing protein [Frankiaceae bacterium]
MTTTPVLAVEGLTKHYRGRVAVDGVTFALPRGVVAGFIGPNGAGKTTTMAMLLGLVRPTRGSGTVLGEPLDRPERYLRRVGALVEGPALWPALTGTENLRALARLGGHDEARIPAVLDLVGLDDRGGDRFGSYSFGMKQRLGIAAALLGDPELLVLDEPTNGLDPVGMSEMRDLIGRLAADGSTTVLVSSHLLGELEQVSDWLLVIDAGRLVYEGPAEGFSAEREVVLAPLDPADLVALAGLLARSGVAAVPDGDRLVVRPAASGTPSDPRALAASLNAAAVSAGIALAQVHVRRPTLESTYFRLLEGELR